jgi:hypothetical protein
MENALLVCCDLDEYEIANAHFEHNRGWKRALACSRPFR